MSKQIAFSFTGTPHSALQQWFAEGMRQTLIERGHRLHPEPTTETDFVINFARLDAPHPVLPSLPNHRTNVLTIVDTEEKPSNPLEVGYPLLPRNVCSIAVLLVGNAHKLATSYFFTLEQGYPEVVYKGDDAEYFARLWDDYIMPRATATWAFENIFRHDLPEEVWEGTPVTDQIIRASRKLAELRLLPDPFPLEQYLTKEQYRFVRLVYKLFGLSYGNISARALHPALPPNSFWMTASGVDKSKIKTIGTDVMLVVGREGNAMVVSLPAWVKQPRRVSVDAVEHHMIYQENPSVGAILHVHGWITEVAPEITVTYTDKAYPCGSRDLAECTAEVVRTLPDPSKGIIAQRNHGLVITGPSLDEIFARIESGAIKINHNVPQR